MKQNEESCTEKVALMEKAQAALQELIELSYAEQEALKMEDQHGWMKSTNI